MTGIAPVRAEGVIDAGGITADENALRAMVARLPAGAYGCDAEGLITWFNPRAVEVWGRAPALQDPADRWCGSFKLRGADGTPIRHEDCWMARAVRENRPYEGREIHVERPDGERRVVLAHANPLHDARGRVIGGINVLVDITESHASDKRLQQERARREKIFDAVGLATARLDADGALHDANAALAALLGAPPQSLEHRKLVDCLHENDRASAQRLLTQLIAGERGQCRAEWRLRRDGSAASTWVQVTVVSSAEEGGVAVCLLEDISARKQAELRLNAAIDSIADYLVSYDRDWRYTYVTEKGAAAMGKTRSELIGRRVWDVFPQAVDDPYYHALRRAAAGGTVSRFEFHNSVDDTWWDTHVYPSDDGVIVFAADATERRRGHEARERLAAIVESSEDAIISKSLDSILNSWNAAAERMFGYTAAEAIGRPVTMLIPEERIDEEAEIIGRLQRGERIEHMQTVRRRKDGTLIEVELTISPLRAADGRVIGASKIARDITERRRQERLLHEREQMLSLAQRAAGAGVWQLDLVTKAVHWSSECHAVYGTDPQSFVPSYERWLECVHPDDRAAVVEAYRQSLVDRQDFSAEFRILHPARGEAWVWAVGNARYGDDGTPLAASGIAMDITERKRSEQAVRLSEERYRSLVEASEAMVFTVGPDGRYVTPQPGWSAYTGQTYDEYCGDGYLAAVHPEDRQRVAAEVMRAVQTESDFRAEGRLWHAGSAEYRWVEARSVPLRDDHGQIREWVGTVTDIHDQRVAQEQAARLAADLRLLTDALPALVGYVDVHQRLQFANKAHEGWFGVGSAELRNRHLREVFGEPIYARISRHVESALSGLRVRFEDEIPHHKGGSRHIRAEYVPDVRPDGRIAGFHSLVYDISDAKRSELALRRSEERYRHVVESQSEMLCRFRPDGTILFANSTYARALGLTSDALIGRSFWDYIPQDDHGRIRQTLQALTPERPELQIENCFQAVDGERWTLWTNRALAFDDAGRLIEAQSSGIDITERKRIEQRLEEEVRTTQSLHRLGHLIAAERELESLVQAVTDEATRLTDAQFGAFFYNVLDARGETYQLYTISGVDRSAFDKFPLPRKTAVFAPTYDGTGVVRSDDITQDPRYGHTGPHHGLPPGHLPVRSYLAVPVATRSGEVLGGLFFGHSRPGVFQDRHERLVASAAAHAAVGIENARLLQQAQQQAQQLREADRRKDEFLALLSHELRNPLAPLRTSLDILRRRGLAESTLRPAVEVMERQTVHLTRLVDDLMEVTRFTRGLIELRRAPLDLADAVREAVDICRPLIDQRGHSLELKLPEVPVELAGDRTRLTQVFANLLNNAAKYTPPGGELAMTLRCDGAQAQLEVRDNGIGIAPEMRRPIFDMFTRVDSSLERSSDGLGIGLSLAQRLVELHGGHIEVESAGTGQGSTFTVHLPLAQAEAAA